MTRASCPQSTFKTCHIAKGRNHHAHLFNAFGSMDIIYICIYMMIKKCRTFVVHLQSSSSPSLLEITFGAAIDTISNTKVICCLVITPQNHRLVIEIGRRWLTIPISRDKTLCQLGYENVFENEAHCVCWSVPSTTSLAIIFLSYFMM